MKAVLHLGETSLDIDIDMRELSEKVGEPTTNTVVADVRIDPRQLSTALAREMSRRVVIGDRR